MSGSHIVVIDDEKDIRNLLEFNLEQEGYKVTTLSEGKNAVEKIKRIDPQLIILDLMLPGIDGLDICRILKNSEDTSHIPVIMLTAKGDKTDVVVGLEMGADDYIAKPFSPKVLIARIKAVLRRMKEKTTSSTRTVRENLTIDRKARTLIISGKQISLTYTEFEILDILASEPGRVKTRDQIIKSAKGEHYISTDRIVDVHINNLRKKLGEHSDLIETVRGVGYRFKDE